MDVRRLILTSGLVFSRLSFAPSLDSPLRSLTPLEVRPPVTVATCTAALMNVPLEKRGESIFEIRITPALEAACGPGEVGKQLLTKTIENFFTVGITVIVLGPDGRELYRIVGKATTGGWLPPPSL